MSQMTARQISPKVTVSVVSVVAMLMTIMDTAIVNLALPTISRELPVLLNRVDLHLVQHRPPARNGGRRGDPDHSGQHRGPNPAGHGAGGGAALGGIPRRAGYSKRLRQFGEPTSHLLVMWRPMCLPRSVQGVNLTNHQNT
jgi:hypothetical protein